MRVNLALYLLWAGAAGCAWPLDLPPLPPVIAEPDGVRIRTHAHRLPNRLLTLDENEALRRAELDAAAADAMWAVRVVRAESPAMPDTVRDLIRARWSDPGFPSGLYHPSLISGDAIWVRDLTDVHVLAHEFGHVLETRLLPASFYDDIPHLPERFADDAGEGAERQPPGGVWVTSYSRENAREWFCEVYGAVIGFAAQLAGPLAERADALDLESLSSVASHFVSLGILRSDTSEFFARVLRDDDLRARVRRVTRIVDQARRSTGGLVWYACGANVGIPASSWREVPASPAAEVPWGEILTFSADRALATDTWVSDESIRAVEDAATALHQLLAFAGLPPEHLAAAIRSRHEAGDPEAAQALASRAATIAALAWREALGEETARQRAQLCAALDRDLAEPPASHSFDLLDLDRDLHHLVRAVAARDDLPAAALTADVRPELNALLEALDPPATFYLYTGLQPPER